MTNSNLDWFNRQPKPSNPNPEGFDQNPAWKPEEIHLDERILVIEST